jgi:hypothetical protein
MSNTATETLSVVVEREIPFPPEQSGFRSDRPQNYQGAKYGWNQFFKNLEQVLERL